jgi:hypothetical protein
MKVILLAVALCGGQPIRQCYTAPIYQQKQYYAAPQHQYYNNHAYVDGVSYVTYEPVYSGIVGAYDRQNNAIKSVADLTKQLGALTTEVGNLRTQIGVLAAGSVPPAPGPNPPPAPPVPKPPDPVVPPSDLEKAATTVFQNKCAKCHTDPAKSGAGFVLLNPDGTLASLAALKKLTLDQKLYSGEMPPDPKQALTAEEYSSVRAWINEDKDAIEAALKGNQK